MSEQQTKSVTISGKMIEIGNLESGAGRGIVLEDKGEHVELIGLSEEECRKVACLFGERTTITVSQPLDPSMGGEDSLQEARETCRLIQRKYELASEGIQLREAYGAEACVLAIDGLIKNRAQPQPKTKGEEG